MPSPGPAETPGFRRVARAGASKDTGGVALRQGCNLQGVDGVKITEAVKNGFRKDLLVWYERHQRHLPWRSSRDPYKILVSEMLLQQTRAQAAESYYLRFVDRFPDLETLARAPLDSVLLVWQGLGYYSRARNLHRSARHLVASAGGRIPSDPEALLALPGIGPYTAAAVASIAFDRDAAVVDGNVIRVLCRVFSVRDDPALPRVRGNLQAIASHLLPRGKAALFNQAVMELGALNCSPRRPDCRSCPLAPICRARREGNPDRLPARGRKAPLPRRTRVVAVVESRGRLLLVRRPPKGFLGGLWEIPGLFLSPGEAVAPARRRLEQHLHDRLKLCPVSGRKPEVLRHSYTHFHENLCVFFYRGEPKGSRNPSSGRKQKWVWLSPRDLEQVPISGATRKILEFARQVGSTAGVCRT